MRNFRTIFSYCIQNPRNWLIISYLAFFYLFCGFWGRLAVKGILAVIVLWIIVHFADKYIFDPLLQMIIKRKTRKERERLHDLTPRIKL